MDGMNHIMTVKPGCAVHPLVSLSVCWSRINWVLEK